MSKGRAVRPAMPRWVRGWARYEDNDIILERPEEYDIYSTKDIVYDLAGVRTPDDALEFVGKHGLLWHGPGADDLREPFEEWEREAQNLRGKLRLYMTLQDALRGDDEARQKLWRVWESDLRPFYQTTVSNDAELFAHVSDFVGHSINDGLAGVEQGFIASVLFEGGQPGVFELAASPCDLVGAAYHELALAIVSRAEMRTCQECGRLFPVTDQRQRYCSERCANRARYQRWARKQRERKKV